MKKSFTLKALSIVMSFAIGLSLLTSCGGDTKKEVTTSSDTPSKEVVINYPTFHIGVNSAAGYFAKTVENFNKEYEGKIKIVVEEIPGDQAYTDKMKLLLTNNDLPAIVNTGGYNLIDPALEKNLVVDLTTYIDADPEWKASVPEGTWEFNSRNGKIYAISEETALMGYFYNKELFEKAGIKEPAKTWDEFFADCDKLVAAGITPVSMDTFDSGWLTSLWFTAMIGSSNVNGLKMVTDFFPKNYNTPEVISAATKIQTMFQKYTTADAVGGKYENGANNFISQKTAMIANGGWMINDFIDAGIDSKIGVALFPDNCVFDAPNPGIFVAAKDKETQDAAVEFVKYLTSAKSQTLALEMVGRVPTIPSLEIPKDVQDKMPLLTNLIEQAKTAKLRFNNYQALWYPNVVDGLSTYYPELATGQITPEQFAQTLTDLAAKN